MITIFGDFQQFLAKNWRFSQKTNVTIIYFLFSFVLSQKRQLFRRFFG
jgi:hypothetical protein